MKSSSKRTRTVKTLKPIMDYFVGTARDVQVQALTAIEKAWDSNDVFVVTLPTGAGKSRIAYTLARYAAAREGGSQILVPNNMLLEQYHRDFPKLHTIYRQDSYVCQQPQYKGELSCNEHKQIKKFRCSDCPYLSDVRKSKVFPYGLYNFYTYMAYKLYQPVGIFDEAHKLLDIIKSLMAAKIWHHKYHYPHWVTTYGKLMTWLDEHPNRDEKLEDLFTLLKAGGKPRFIVERGSELYNGDERECLKISPVDTSSTPPTLWPPGRVKKLILMSATIGMEDIYQMGLAGRRICLIDTDSPIPKERRPVIYLPEANMAFAHQVQSIPKIAELIKELAAHHHDEKGLIHVPYSVALKLKPYLTEERYIFHDKGTKGAAYGAFKGTEEPQILVASGMYEGLDCPYDAARWQVIGKIPWPSLAEPAIQFAAEERPEWYVWETMKTVIQACGRVCRAMDDYGTTYIVDSSFERMYKGLPEHTIYKWWKDSIIWPSKS